MFKFLQYTTAALAVFALSACDHNQYGSKSDYSYSYGSSSYGMNEVHPMHDTILFGYDSSVLPKESDKIVHHLAEHIKDNPNTHYVIEGHCDMRGTKEYNIGLGERRANAVKKHLMQHGVDAEQLVVVSYGKEKPVDMGTTSSAHAANRRAVVVPM